MMDLIYSWFATEIFYILLTFLIIFSILIHFIYKYRDESKEDKNKVYISKLSKAILYSLIFLFLIFIGFYFFPSKNGLFRLLTSGDVIIGIAIASPIIFTWYENYIEKQNERIEAEQRLNTEQQKNEKEKEDRKIEREKKEYEAEIYRYYDELKKDYTNWFEQLYVKKIINPIDGFLLKELIERYNEFIKRFNDSNVVESLKPIDFFSLFMTLQSKFEEIEDTIKVSEYLIWQDMNTLIFEKLNERYDLYRNDFSLMESIYAVDFKKNRELITSLERCYKFVGCFFDSDQIKENLSNDYSYILKDIIFDTQIATEIINEIKQDSNDIEFEYYFVFNKHSNKLPQKVKINTDSDPENFDETKLEGDHNSIELIYENRDLSEYGPINNYLFEGKVFSYEPDNTENLSVKKKVVKFIEENVEGLKGEEEESFFVSKSKNFITGTDVGTSKWQWHSWNVINKTKIDDSKIQYFVFLVKLKDSKYEFLIIETEKLKELNNMKITSKDNRYFYYFVKEKNRKY